MFKVNTYQPTSDTLTPTKLLMNPAANDWNFHHKSNSMADFNPYMSEINPFDTNTNDLFDQKFQQAVPSMMMMPPPSPEEDSSNHSLELTRPMASPPSSPPTTDTPPKKQRKKLLEKNREAAYRCRQKKKKWIHDLEEKSVVVESKNKELQEQVSQLREESIYLRNLLLTHGNCNCKVVQAYLRRTSEQLSSSMSNTGLTQLANSPTCSSGHENFGN
ncbi:Transcription factor atf21 [Choanephora cucurbitarum]|uniref:Transcription factor atf21 n=1 Tax=Choanephora cucurbitarum TaxID=101091 RepID=A0A1C7N318_9FUNG|nr:Transcription factor atf21 [Choanephora cucurbitarum]